MGFRYCCCDGCGLFIFLIGNCSTVQVLQVFIKVRYTIKRINAEIEMRREKNNTSLAVKTVNQGKLQNEEKKT